jgi:hypothetical protein
MVEVTGPFRDHANAPKKPTGASNLQGVTFVISLSSAFAMGCRLLCSKAAVLTYVLYKVQNVNGFKNGTSESSQI